MDLFQRYLLPLSSGTILLNYMASCSRNNSVTHYFHIQEFFIFSSPSLAIFSLLSQVRSSNIKSNLHLYPRLWQQNMRYSQGQHFNFFFSFTLCYKDNRTYWLEHLATLPNSHFSSLSPSKSLPFT